LSGIRHLKCERFFVRGVARTVREGRGGGGWHRKGGGPQREGERQSPGGGVDPWSPRVAGARGNRDRSARASSRKGMSPRKALRRRGYGERTQRKMGTNISRGLWTNLMGGIGNGSGQRNTGREKIRSADRLTDQGKTRYGGKGEAGKGEGKESPRGEKDASGGGGAQKNIFAKKSTLSCLREVAVGKSLAQQTKETRGRQRLLKS